MAGFFLFGVLASFGLLSILWAALGWLLPNEQGTVLVCMGLPDEGILSRYRWLRSLGLLCCPLVAVTDTLPQVQPGDYEICSGEELPARLEWERNFYHGTGNGDPSGRHQRRGISKL